MDTLNLNKQNLYFRMLNTANLNLTRIAGKPIIISNKAGLQGQRQNIIVTDGSSNTINNVKRTEAQTNVVKPTQVGILNFIKCNSKKNYNLIFNYRRLLLLNHLW